MAETQARTTWPLAAELQRAAFQLRNPFHLPGLTVSIDPDVAVPLADWLDATANALAWLAPYRPNEGGYEMWETASAVARVINGATPAPSDPGSGT